MRSIPLAMTWEFWRRGRWSFLLIGSAMAGIFAMLLASLQYFGALDPEEQAVRTLHWVLLIVQLMGAAGAAVEAQGPLKRFYAWPVSTGTIAVWQLLPGMVAVAILYLVSAALMNVLFGLDWPLWGPALFSAAALPLGMGTFLATGGSIWRKMFCLCLVTILAIVWLSRCYHGSLGEPTQLWMEVTPVEFLTMATAAIVGGRLVIIGIERDRHGGAWEPTWFLEWFDRWDVKPPLKRSATPLQAQLWSEWEQKGWVPLLVQAMLSIGALVAAAFEPHVTAENFREGVLALGGMLVLFAFFHGVIIGCIGMHAKKADAQIGEFLASRPITNAGLAAAALRTGARSLLYAWVFWAVTRAGLLAILWISGYESFLAPSAELALHVGVLVGAWVAMSNGACLILTGQNRFLFCLVITSVNLTILGLILGKFVLPERIVAPLQIGLLWLVGVFLPVATIGLFELARRRSLINSQTIIAAGAVWGLLSTIVWFYPELPSAHPGPGGLALLTSALSLCVLPLAAAPLAITWNRHR